jgi:hypothetical protein
MKPVTVSIDVPQPPRQVYDSGSRAGGSWHAAPREPERRLADQLASTASPPTTT